ncbi:hypothetical protein [Methylomonas fluvii]|nr:hypothetical protein [Methylomonas fluvii]
MTNKEYRPSQVAKSTRPVSATLAQQLKCHQLKLIKHCYIMKNNFLPTKTLPLS